MIELIYEILKNIAPIKWMKTPEIKNKTTVISYHFFNAAYGLYGNGKGTQKGGTLQVDIYSKEDYTNVTNSVITALEGVGFRATDERDSLEELDSNTPLYHKILIFNYLESEVL